jgi:phage baseplate assembly protein gpV
MEHTESAIGLEQIQVISPYGLVQLTDFRISSKPNQHTRVSFRGMVGETQKDSCIEKAGVQDRIEVNLTDAGQKARPLFKGVVTQIKGKTVRDNHYLEVEALSHTYLLDLKLKNRSFQNLMMSYGELFQLVLADYSRALFTDRATRGTKLQGVIIQYQETDWALLVRAASHCGAVLIPDSTADSPRFWIGVPDGLERQIANVHYSLGKNLAEYRISSQNFAASTTEIDFTGYRVDSNQMLDIGDRVRFQGANLVVVQASGAIQQGALKYEYLLTRKDGICQNKAVNKQLRGGSLHGKVIDRRQDQVRLHLEIDRVQNKDEAYWFKVATSYTAEGNSGWYCMPEPGDRVRLYLPNCQEESATVVGALRENGATNPKIADPDVKYCGNTHGKELRMDAQELRFTAKESRTGRMFIRLDAADGVEIESDQPIKFQSDEDIAWDAKTIAINASHGVYMVCNQSNLFIDKNVDFKAGMVRVEGLMKDQENASEDSASQSKPEKTAADKDQDESQDSDQTGLNRDVISSIPGQAVMGDEAESNVGFNVLGSIPQRIN